MSDGKMLDAFLKNTAKDYDIGLEQVTQIFNAGAEDRFYERLEAYIASL